MDSPFYDPIVIPLRSWRLPSTRAALQARDVRALFALAKTHGATQTRLAIATGMTQGRVSEVMRGVRTITAMEKYERVAEGLGMPDEARMMFGLAPQHPAGLDHLGPIGRAEIIQTFPSQSTAAQDIRTAARQVTAINVLAVRGLGILGLNDSLLRSELIGEPDVQRTLRVLLLSPDGEAAARRAEEINETPETFSAGIRLAEARLKELGAIAPSLTVEVHRYDTLPIWRLIILDEIQYVSAFGQKWEGHESAVYKIAPTPRGALHRGFRRLFEQTLRTAQRII
ncbi:hypothetical protein [Nonomuraea fuscirosea]|uniref:hypothetical protein n=1 Tax=Nonomuraea fuscirosea TaxID=1291556 RepID=UPI0034477E2D